MTAEEIRKAITFTESNGQIPNTKVVVGTLTISCGETIHLEDYKHQKEEVLDSIRWRILQAIYNDQRRALYSPLIDLMKVDPFNFGQTMEMRQRLIKAAEFQPPEDFRKNDT